MSSPLLSTYNFLLKSFGTQGWWPTTPKKSLIPHYHSFPRTAKLTEREQFEIAVGAILTQNTAWTNVEKALRSMHSKNLWTPQSINLIPDKKLATLIRPSGYFRQKAKKLKLFSRHLLTNHQGKISPLLKQHIPEARLELLSIFGIGSETADSILLYAGGKPVFVVDAYTRRMGQRMGFFSTDRYETIQSYFEYNLIQDARLYNEYHALIVQLGKGTANQNRYANPVQYGHFVKQDGKEKYHERSQQSSLRSSFHACGGT